MIANAPGRFLRIDWGRREGDGFGIADVIARTDVPASSIHHYARLGLIPQPERVAPNRFLYDDRHVAALGIIRSLRQRGRTLEEIREVLPELWRLDGVDSHAAVDDYIEHQQCAPAPSVRLMDAAIEAFGQQSFGEVTIDGICAGAGIAKGTFYRHFPNKEALFLAASREVVERAVNAFSEEMKDGLEADYVARFARHLRPALPLLFELGKRSVRDSGPVMRDAISLFVDLVERLGRVVRSDSGQDAAQTGGVLVIMSLVQIFTRLLEDDSGSSAGVPDTL
ncbi:MAG TPA: TetR family transcriptional regulator [Ilumatobacteraceae bacterium]|nr:TetR family transcriptional regulator [Ilumatobacteraceae bacterium]